MAWGRGKVLRREQVPSPPVDLKIGIGGDSWLYAGLRYWHFWDGKLVAYVRWAKPDRREAVESWVDDDDPRPFQGPRPL